jgi:DNA-binding ferritin-like protein
VILYGLPRFLKQFSCIFDKAEEAGSIEKLKESQRDLLREKEKLAEKIRHENDKETKIHMEEQAQLLDKRAEMLKEIIEQKEKEKNEKT